MAEPMARREHKIGDSVVIKDGRRVEGVVTALACDSLGDVQYVRVKYTHTSPFWGKVTQKNEWHYANDAYFLSCERA